MIGRLAETWVRRPSTPTRLVFDVTRRCNLRCAMCKTWEKPSEGELSADAIASILAQLPRLTWLDVTGGEPFLRRDIEQVLGAALCIPPALTVLHFQTNGWSPARIAEITERVRSRREGVDLIVTVSIDGPEPVHDAVRGRQGSAARALDTLARLEPLAGVEVHVGTTISDRTVDGLPALEEILRSRGFDLRRWHWNWLQTSAHFFGNEGMEPRSVPTQDLLLRHIARRGVPRTLVQLMEAAYLVNLDAVQRGEPSGVPCQALRSAAFISPEGDLFPCHLYGRNLGSVQADGVAALWDAPHVHEARRDIEALACGGCFSACEAYPALAGAPIAAARVTARRLVQLSRRGRR
ncbi:MAG: radical SAM protein [Myxococcota bacterium]